MALQILILAAGQGKRMCSDLPKVLQPLAGRPLLAHVIDTVNSLSPDRICVVYGHGGELVREAFSGEDLGWVLQAEQLGTGHAVLQALPHMGAEDVVLILCGDVPLVRAATIEPLIDAARSDQLAILTTDLDDPTGYGRIVRDIDSHVLSIVEEKDATNDQKSIREINTGLMACRAPLLSKWLERISPDNAQGEYYLTDAVAAMAKIVSSLQHFPNEADKEALASIVAGDSGDSIKAVAAAIAGISHKVSDSDKVVLEAIAKDDAEPARLRELASIIVGVNHMPSPSAKSALAALSH